MQAKRPGWFRATLAKAFLALALFPCLIAINQPAAYAANCTPIISYSGAYTIETFTATSGCSWTTPLNVFTADVLVVGAGGGAGGGAFDNLGSKSGGGGGGGAGAVIAHTISLTPNTATNVIVGSGGTGGVGGFNGGSWGGMPGSSGGSTYFLSDTATGGGFGLGGGSWGLQSDGSRCDAHRPLNFSGVNIYYIDGVGGKGGASGSANGGSVFTGGKPYCTTTTNSPEAVGSAGGSGGGSAGNASDGATSGDIYTATAAGTGTASSITGALVTYGVGGSGGNGGTTGAVGTLGSTPGTGGGGGVGSTSATSSATTQGGNGADGVVIIRFIAQSGVTLTLAGSPTSVIYRTATSINASLLGSNGYVTFYANKKAIPGCKRILSSAFLATCTWKPPFHGVVTLSATITPTTNGYQVASAIQTIFVKQRTSLR
jgi:hypothetical protein